MTASDVDKPEEQRKFPRVAKNVSIEISVLSYPPSDEKAAGTSRNISGCGIRILSPVPYTAGTPLNLSIGLSGWQEYKKPFSILVDLSSEKPLNVIGEVVWCKPDRLSTQHEIGIKFLNIYEDDFKALKAYLEDQ